MSAPVRSDIPTLILTGYFDDRAPTEHAYRIAAALSRVYLVEFPDEGHDTRPPACHTAIVAQFLEDPTLGPDTSCVAAIPPIPFATAWEAASSAVADPYHPPPRDTVEVVAYKGWQQYCLQCARCHGEDGHAPSREEFLEILTKGREDKGMPSAAGRVRRIIGGAS
jgi:hypothetical protein